MRIDHYNFSVLAPYKCEGDSYKTLRAAKSAYKKHLEKRYRLGCSIYGRTKKGDNISFTPWYYDAFTFGQTKLTNIGQALTKRNK